MPLWLIGVIGIGAYLLLTKNGGSGGVAQGGLTAAQQQSNAAYAAWQAANPTATGIVPPAGGSMTPAQLAAMGLDANGMPIPGAQSTVPPLYD